MKRFYCDICETEIIPINVKVVNIGFNRFNVDLCGTCFSKFGEAKANLFDEYNSKYNNLDDEYMEALKDEVLENENPEPEFEGGE